MMPATGRMHANQTDRRCLLREERSTGKGGFYFQCEGPICDDRVDYRRPERRRADAGNPQGRRPGRAGRAWRDGGFVEKVVSARERAQQPKGRR